LQHRHFSLVLALNTQVGDPTRSSPNLVAAANAIAAAGAALRRAGKVNMAD
jgi:hypothetical protein